MLSSSSTDSTLTASSSIAHERKDSPVTSSNGAVTQPPCTAVDMQSGRRSGMKRPMMAEVATVQTSDAVVCEDQSTAASLPQSSRGKLPHRRGSSEGVRRGKQNTTSLAGRTLSSFRQIRPAAAVSTTSVPASVSRDDVRPKLRQFIINSQHPKLQHGMSSVECLVANCPTFDKTFRFFAILSRILPYS